MIARRDRLTALTFDAVELDVEAVTVDGRAAGSTTTAKSCASSFPSPRPKARSWMSRSATRASRAAGSTSSGRTPTIPSAPLQCWTQGQDDDSRYYWPCIDHPIEKFTTEVICAAPAGNFVLSNGVLRERVELPGDRVRWHYALEFPQPAYLVTLAAGPFVEIADRAPRTGVDVFYFVPPGREADARRSFRRTPEMIDFFSERIGVPYAYPRYSQITVAEFIFGGMENTTATTLTDLVLLDERAALDSRRRGAGLARAGPPVVGRPADLPRVVRGLAERGLRDLLRVRLARARQGTRRGRPRAAGRHRRLPERGRALPAPRRLPPVRGADPPLRRAPLREGRARAPHAAARAGRRGRSGASIGLYARKHAHGSVETRDLARAIEEATGRNVDELLDRWIARPGHPELEGRWEWDEDRKIGTLRIAQKQPITPEAPPFKFSAPVRFEIDGRERDERVSVSEATHAFEFHAARAPDPGDLRPGRRRPEVDPPGEESGAVAAPAGGGAAGGRSRGGGRALGQLPDPAGIAGLAAALRDDAFWGVRAAAARALGQTRRDDARDALVAAIDDEHPRVRRAVAAALGDFLGDEAAGRALADRLRRGDASYFVEAEAALALGRTRTPR